jgi:hypothetical protein
VIENTSTPFKPVAIPRRFAQLFDKLAHDLPLNEHDHAFSDRVQSELSKLSVSPPPLRHRRKLTDPINIVG